ncbi:hypothetical protein [Sphingomonas oryzagri]|uniref:DUF1640 domain-containing protein n=1 Tax=Sphingomonas oryzagri TaxID=3042314 RepID=A0ABT6N0Z3_9SPHN|nr:hypothetical protein [Sphingomonas oryzagri]MDH7638971.1 hypothetical protein [Sphingomonas oryzagri]
MSPSKPFGESGEILTPVPDETIARLGEVAALRQLTDTINRMGRFMQTLSEQQGATTEKLAEMHTDITVMKLQDEKIAEMKERISAVESRVDLIDLLHAKQEGAGWAVTLAKDFGPTIVNVAIFIVLMMKAGVIHA